jgi:uncharacterized protein (DUF1501 family)
MNDCLIDRRRFIQWAGAGVFAAMTTQLSLESLASAASATPLSAGTPILVIVTLYGGNDGLNTVVPFTDPNYHSSRSNIALSGSQLLSPISDTLAFNSSMPQINTLYGQNKVAIVQGVSYPNPNLSHFSSMSIWQSGSLTGAVTSGWIGRWLDRQPHNPFTAIGVGSTVPPLLVGDKSVASMVDLGPLWPPSGVGSTILPRLGNPSSSDVALEAAAATSISDLYSTWCAARSAGQHVTVGFVYQRATLARVDTHQRERAHSGMGSESELLRHARWENWSIKMPSWPNSTPRLVPS